MCDFDDDFGEDEFVDDEHLQNNTPDEALIDGHYDPVLGWMIWGPLSEQIARERYERERIRRKMFD